MGERLTETFMALFCEKNSDGTKHFKMLGRDLVQRYGKRLNHMDMLHISYYLTEHPEIVSLNVAYNNIGDLGLEILAENYFCRPNTLVDLNLISCDISPYGLAKLYGYRENIKLITLRLTGNKFARQGGEYCAKFLEDVPSLRCLELGDSHQTIFGVDFILNKARNSNLLVLDLSAVVPRNEYASMNTPYLAHNISLFLEANPVLAELHLEKCQLSGHEAEVLVLALVHNKHLRLLNLAGNRISNFGLEVISKWLGQGPGLLGLDVSSNGIGDIGARALSFGMSYSKLRFLNIGNNIINDNGMANLLDTLKKPYVLRLFYFFGNPFGQKTMKIIRRMLSSQVLEQRLIDVKLYEVDGLLQAAYYPTNQFKQQYYSCVRYGCATELKIRRNVVEEKSTRRRPFYNLPHYERYPPMD